VSSGCIRLFNHDIIDLYDRVSVGAPVVVLQEAPEPSYPAAARAVSERIESLGIPESALF
jgi:L,D-transpeptidase-like protein